MENEYKDMPSTSFWDVLNGIADKSYSIYVSEQERKIQENLANKLVNKTSLADNISGQVINYNLLIFLGAILIFILILFYKAI